MDEKPDPGPDRKPSYSSASTPSSTSHSHGESSVASTPASTSTESSVDWLLRVSREKNRNQPPSADTRPADKDESTQEYLIRVSHAFIHAMNRRDFEACYAMSELIDHSRFTAKLTDYLLVKSFQEHVDNCVYRCSYAPDVHFEITMTNATVNENKGLAYIWVNIEARDQPGGIGTQGVGQWEWRKLLSDGEEKWLCSKYSAVKGLPPEGLV